MQLVNLRTSEPALSSKLRAVVHVFNYIFSVFKQYYTYFYFFFSPTRILKKIENYYLNTYQTSTKFLFFDTLICKVYTHHDFKIFLLYRNYKL